MMTSAHSSAFFVAILLLIPAVFAQSTPSAAGGQAILDQPLVGDVLLPVLGGQLTLGVDMVFANSADKAPNSLNTGTISIGFTTATVLPGGGKVIITLPLGYFTSVDSSKLNTFFGTAATCKCTLTIGLNTDTVTCTTSAALAIGSVTLNFAAGTVTTGAPTAAASYNVQTSVDRALTSEPATSAIGGVITAVSIVSFATADKVPGTVNAATVKIGFSVATAIPVGGKVTLIMPKNYFSAVSSTAVNTFDSRKVTATCILVKASGTETKDNVVCTTAVDVLSAAAQTLVLSIGAVTTGAPTDIGSFTVKSSTDRESVSAATAALGGILTNLALTIPTAGDTVPGTINSGVDVGGTPGAIALTFTTTLAIPIGGTLTITLPPKYFSAVDASKSNTFNTTGTAVTTTAKCALTPGTTGTTINSISNADTIVCTTSVAVLAVGLQVMYFVPGAVTAGSPQAAALFTVQTSVDRALTANTIPLGGALASGTLAFVTATDKIPGTINTGNVTFGFTTVTALPVGGKVTLALPSGYLSFVDSNKANSFNGGGTAKCSLIVGVVGTAVLGVNDADSVICTVAGLGLAAGTAITLDFMAGTVRTGTPQTDSAFNIATSVDRQLPTTLPTTKALGGSVVATAVVAPLAIATDDKHPFTVNAAAIEFKFNTTTDIPTGGKIFLSVPRGYFSKVDESKVNTLTLTTFCTCALTQATGVAIQDTITCTTSGAILANGAQTLTLIAGAVTTGAATAAGTFDVATSVDKKLTGLATVQLGGSLTAPVALAFANADDRIPGKYSSTNSTITLGFVVATQIPVGGKITITLPQGYFSKVDASKENSVGSSATAKCALANVAQTPIAVSISPATTTVEATSTLTINLIASIVTGMTQIAIPLAGFALSAGSAVSCTNCASAVVTAAISNNVLTLTFAAGSSITLKNTLTVFTITSVKNPAVAGWATTGIAGIAFNPSTTVVCTTAGSVVAAAVAPLTFTFVSGAVTVGSGQKASTFHVETSTDLAVAGGVTEALGGGLTVGRPLAFANAQDQVPGQVNSGSVSLGVTLANSVPIGGQFLLTFPTNYFTNVNPASVVSLTRGARRNLLQQSTLSCVRTAGTPTDQIACTLAGAASGTGPVVISFPPGSLTTGLPVFVPGGPTGFNVATANPLTVTARVPYFPKASAASHGVAVLFVALSALLALF